MPRSSLHSAVEPFLRRARWRATARGAVDGSIVGAVLAGCALAAGQLSTVGGWPLAGVALAGSVVVGVVASRWRLPSAPRLLTSLDADFDLKARVRTAWESEASSDASDDPSPLVEAQVRDAIARLSARSPRDWIPRLLPRRAWGTPVVVGLAAATLLIPARGVAEPQLTAPQREAIGRAAKTLSDDEALSKRLRAAQTVDEALAALADVEERVETYEESRQALDATRDALRDVAAGPSPADALRDVESTSYPALQDQLRNLRDKLARNATTVGLAQALEGVETRDVTEATLRKIVEELRKLEDAARTEPLASLAEIRQQKSAVALAAIDAQAGGTNARTDGVAGTETGDMVAQGSRLANAAAAQEAADAMLLRSLESSSLRESRVQTRRRDANGLASEPELMPFREAVANARAGVAYAVQNNELPVAYRDRIRRYFDALQQIAEEDAP
jgi:hypothetical protein